MAASLQVVSITLSAGSGSNTATLSPAVDTSKTILVFQGTTTTVNSQTQSGRHGVRITLTNSTTVTATRENTAQDVTVKAVAITFSSGVNSIQYGTIAIGVGAASNTANLGTAVGATAFVLWLGASTAVGSLNSCDVLGSVELNTTTDVVTARNLTGTTLTVGYCVADLDSTIVESVQAVAHAAGDADVNTSFTDTISSVDVDRTLIFYNGFYGSVGFGANGGSYHQVLTNATTVTSTRNGTAAGVKNVLFTVVQFATGVFSSAVQRGTITLSAATSNTATISSVDTTRSFVNWCNYKGASANSNTILNTLTLTNATTVTDAVSSAGSIIASYEVAQFAAGGRTTKNTRSNPLGTEIGMGWRMECAAA